MKETESNAAQRHPHSCRTAPSVTTLWTGSGVPESEIGNGLVLGSAGLRVHILLNTQLRNIST